MATVTDETDFTRAGNLGVLRLAMTGSLAAAIFYMFCWIGAQLPISPATHMYLRLFTDAPVSSRLAVIEGVCWSIGFGLLAGALIALVYNALAFLDRR